MTMPLANWIFLSTLLVGCIGGIDNASDQGLHSDGLPSATTLTLLDNLRSGELATTVWEQVQVDYRADSLSDGWHLSYHCTAAGPDGGFDVTFGYPPTPPPLAARRTCTSNGRPFRRMTVANELYTANDSMDINIIYSELDSADLRRPIGRTGYLLVYSTPMNWVGRMVSEWRFVQLVAFREECVYELALRR